MTEHHRFLLRQLFDHLRFTESKLSQIEQEIDRRMRPFQDEVIRLCTIPGVDQVTAWGILSEIGLDMNQFPSAEHLSSWACLCPGNFESAGKRLSGKMRKGNVRSEEHTSELQSRLHLVCRLLLEKKNCRGATG